MSFLVPSLLQDSAPAPTDASVYLESRNEFRVVAKQFPGIPGDLDFTIQAAELYGLATEAGLQVYTVKKGSRVSRLQPGCHLPNSPWAGIIQL